MATYGTFWILYKLVLPLIILFVVLANLPRIIGAILAIPLAIIMMPFVLSFMGFRYWFQNRERNKTRVKEEEYYSYQKFEEEPKAQASKTNDLYSLLGVRYNASKEEIRAAFKNKMMMNHPDKLAALDPELQRIATERTIAIKDAYERLTASIH